MRKRRHRVDTGERCKPTPETVANLVADPLFLLKLDPDLERAADEINKVVRCVYSKSRLHLASLERFEIGITTIPDAIAQAHNERFIPWARENTASGVDETLKIVVDREPVAQTRLVVIALGNYAKRY